MSAHIVKREGGVYWFESCGGDNIGDNVKEVIEKLKELEAEGQQVKGVLKFNGIELELLHNSDPELALVVWKSLCDKRREEYEASPEYAAEQTASAQRLVNKQRSMDANVVEIKKILTDWAAKHGGSGFQPDGEIACRLMLLLQTYIEDADNIHITHYGEEILPLLEAAGYKQNEFTRSVDGRSPVKQYETRSWFVGQMIDMMKSHGCAHPGLAYSVEKYKLHLNP